MPSSTSTPGSGQFGLLDDLAQEFAARNRRGERPTLKEYTDRYPELADAIRDLFPAMVEMHFAEAELPHATGPGPSQPAPTAPALRQVGDYRIDREIGRGGMGIVYEAEQVSLGRRVALKVLPRHAVGASAVERFRREARAAAKLHHTNIVPLFEVGQDAEVSYYAMQLIRGCGLDQVIAELRRMRDHAEGTGAPARAVVGQAFQPDIRHQVVARSPDIATGTGSARVSGPRRPPDRRSPPDAPAHEPAVSLAIGAPPASQPAAAPAASQNPASHDTADVSHLALSLLTGQFAARAVADESAEEGVKGSPAESRPDKPPQPEPVEGSATRPETPSPEPAPAGSPAVERSSSSLTMPGGAPLSEVKSGERAFHLSVAQIGRQVAGALAHAHARGIIHRDIKPSNLLLDGEGTVWISDFGLAKAEEEAMTTTGDIVGTLRYMAPERFRGETSPPSDVYSLGLTLYELLALRVPFDSPDRLRLIEQIKSHEPASRRAIDARIPRDLETIVLKAIEKDPKRRYATAAALAEDLQRFIEGEPIRARRVSELERLWMAARRHRTTAALLTLFLAALVAGTAFSTVFAIRAARERDRAITAGAEAKAVLDFLKNDLLAQAGTGEQGKIRPDITPQPNLTVRTLLDRAAERIEGKFQGQPLVEATIRETIGIAYTEVNSFDKAEPNLKRALELRRREHGETTRETLSLMNQLFWLYQTQVDYRKAEPLGRKTLELCRKALGEDDPVTLDVMGNLAWLYIEHGRVREAQPLAIKFLETCRRVFGENHLETAVAYNTMGRLRTIQARYADAEKHFLLSLEIRRRILGNEHPGAIAPRCYLGQMYLSQGKIGQAEQEFRGVLQLERRIYGEEHPQTLITMSDVGRVYWQEGKYAEAESLLSKVLEGWRRIAGDDHPNALNAKRMLGAIRQVQGKYVEAEKLMTEALEGYRRKMGEQHISTISAMSSLVGFYWTQGKYKEGQELVLKALEAYRRTRGENDRLTISAMIQLSWELASAPESSGVRDPAKAVELARKVVAAFPKEARYWNTLAAVEYQAGDWEQAIKALEKATEVGKEGDLGDHHPSTIVAMNDLSYYLAIAPESSGLRDPARAVALGKKAVAASPQVGNYWNTLGVAQYRASDWHEAIKALEKSMELRKGGDSFDWFFLAMAHWQLGHRTQARQWYTKAVDGMNKAKSRDAELVRFRAEAEALIVSDTALPANVFAP